MAILADSVSRIDPAMANKGGNGQFQAGKRVKGGIKGQGRRSMKPELSIMVAGMRPRANRVEKK